MRMLIGIFLLCMCSPYLHAEDSGDLVGFAHSFYDNCAAVEALAQHSDTREQEQRGMFCLGFAEGLNMAFLAKEIHQDVKRYCPASELSNVQIVRIVRKYIGDNRQRAHELTVLLAADALQGAFPCKK